MVGRKREGALSKDEKKIVKALLGKGWRNQDIQALLNIGRLQIPVRLQHNLHT